MAKKRSSRRVPVLAAAVAALALLVAHLLDCLPGFGVGGEPASGPPVPTQPEPEPEPVAPEEPAEIAGLSITVRGGECQIGSEPPTTCESVCERLAGEADRTRDVEVDATHGSHGAVEELVRCLTEAGISKVHVRSE